MTHADRVWKYLERSGLEHTSRGIATRMRGVPKLTPKQVSAALSALKAAGRAYTTEGHDGTGTYWGSM